MANEIKEYSINLNYNWEMKNDPYFDCKEIINIVYTKTRLIIYYIPDPNFIFPKLNWDKNNKGS